MNPILIAAVTSRRRHRDEQKEEEVSVDEILFIVGCLVIIFLIGLLIGCLFISG